MGVFLENSTFYHMPKTGGTWVRKVLHSGAVSGKIVTFNKYFSGRDTMLNRKHLPPSLVTLKNFSFAFVRHPFGWYESIWKYRTRFGKWRARNNCGLTKTCASDDFNEFIDNVIAQGPYYGDLVKEFSSVDFMGRYENLVEDLIKALTMAGEKFDEKAIRKYGRVNSSREVKLRYRAWQKKKLLEVERDVVNSYYK